MQRTMHRVGIVVVAMLVAMLVVGCGAQTDPQDEARRANHNYMSQVNSIMAELGENLVAFNDAVARDDVVGMRTQATNACKVLDSLAGLEAPAVLSDVHDKYMQGSDKLRQALEAYVTLYTEAKTAGENGTSIDSKEFAKRLGEIQGWYDEGVAALSAGDELAASK